MGRTGEGEKGRRGEGETRRLAADLRQSPASPSLPSASLGLLHTAVLVNFAFTARLYDLLRREPTFFTVRQAGPLDIVALVAVLSLLLPGVFLLVEVIARGIGPANVADRAHGDRRRCS